ncbi:MAG: helix-turn-helix transcriptional regulator [Leptolyngbyaceae cyanobacterium]
MTIRLTDDGLFLEQWQTAPEEKYDALDELDYICNFDTQVIQGWRREIDLREGISLVINHYRPKEPLQVIYQSERSLDEIKFSFALLANGQWNIKSHSGETLLPCATGTYLIRSNGLTLYGVGDFSDALPYDFIEIYVKPSLLYSFDASLAEGINQELKDIVKPSNQEIYYLQTRSIQPAMAAVLQQILRCSYSGVIKRAYLESKAIELIALVLEHERVIKAGKGASDILKPEQKERIYYAREILLRDLSNPPSLTELAQQVGLNASLLGKGFQQIFGTTVFEQLQTHRLEISQQLLAEQDISVTEVAHLVGYASLSYFSRAFKRKFGVGPKTYQKACS